MDVTLATMNFVIIVSFVCLVEVNSKPVNSTTTYWEKIVDTNRKVNQSHIRFGDIRFTEEQLILIDSRNRMSPKEKKMYDRKLRIKLYRKNAIREKRGLINTYKHYSVWTDGVVPYIFSEKIDKLKKQAIRKQMDVIETMTRTSNVSNCIRFVEYSKDPPTNHVKIVNSNGCMSDLGMRSGGNEISVADSNCANSQAYLHELLHTLGFFHETERPDREKYLKINWENIDYMAYGDFGDVSEEFIDIRGNEYDPDSFMQFTNDYKSISGNTLEWKSDPNRKLGGGKTLSPGDIKGIRVLYKCKKH